VLFKPIVVAFLIVIKLSFVIFSTCLASICPYQCLGLEDILYLFVLTFFGTMPLHSLHVVIVVDVVSLNSCWRCRFTNLSPSMLLMLISDQCFYKSV
jgi:hypothetical protein